MQISQEKVEGLRQHYKVVVTAQDFQKNVTDRLMQIGKKVRMDGFRPGKAPMNIIKQRYSAQAMEEALNNTIHTSLHKITKDHSLRQATQPKVSVETFEEGKDVEITIELEVFPDIAVKEFKSISLEKLTVDLSDAEVEKRLQEITQNHKKFAEPTKARAAKEGDRVHFTFTAMIEGKPFTRFGESLTVELGDQSLLSGKIEEALTGAKTGSEVTAEELLPADFGDQAVADKMATFTMQVTKIEEPGKVELNDELAKELGCENLEDLRKRVRESLDTEYKNLARLRLKRHLLDNLSESYKFDLPPSMVEGEFNAIWQRLQAELTQAKADGSLSAEDDRPEAELRTEYQGIAERRVRLGLLISEIARLNKIKVNDEEVRRAIFAEAMRYPQQVKQVFEFFQKNPAAVEQIAAPILEDKVVDFILNGASLTERKVDVDGLMQAVRGVVPGYEDDESTEATSTEKKPAKAKSTKSKGKAA